MTGRHAAGWLRARRAGANEWTRRRPFLTAFLAMLLVVVPGFIRTQQLAGQQAHTAARQAQDNQDRIEAESTIIAGLRSDVLCVESWANTYVGRSREIQALAVARVDDLFEALNEATSGHLAQARREYQVAAAADRAYRRYLAAHPIPGLGLSCQILSVGPLPPSTVSTPTPSPSVRTSYVPKPGPTTTVAGPTRTVDIPGPRVTSVRTVTRHATRTVTVTRTPRRCRPLGIHLC